MTAPHPDIVESTVEANGLRFATLAMGEGPLALCLHGFPDSAWTWQHLLPELAAAGFRAVAPFLRGYAPTEVPADGLYQPGAIARDAIALHEALGRRRRGGDRRPRLGRARHLRGRGPHARALAAPSSPRSHRRPPVAQAFFSYDQLQTLLVHVLLPVAPRRPGRTDGRPGLHRPALGRLVAGVRRSEHAGRCKAALRDPANLAAAIGSLPGDARRRRPVPECDLVEAAGALRCPCPRSTSTAAPTAAGRGAHRRRRPRRPPRRGQPGRARRRRRPLPPARAARGGEPAHRRLPDRLGQPRRASPRTSQRSRSPTATAPMR
ncbi:MAG: hypothetical protein R2711_05520 [Acidimicrobiales bacterium]